MGYVAFSRANRGRIIKYSEYERLKSGIYIIETKSWEAYKLFVYWQITAKG